MNKISTERNGASRDVISEALKIHTSNTGRIKDRVARQLVRYFLKSLEDFESDSLQTAIHSIYL